MEISGVTIRILLLFFPGLISTYIVDAFTIHKPRTPFFFILQSFVYGFSSYLLYWGLGNVVYWFMDKGSFTVNFLMALVDSSATIDFKEIIFVSGVAVVLSLIFTACNTYKIHTCIAHKLRITKKFGELDVWGFVFNSKEVEWVTVRDHKNDMMYDGWVKAFSDDSINAELLLRDVVVYKNLSGEKLYDIGAMYLSLDRSDIAIEFRDVAVSGDQTQEQEDGND